MSKYQYKNLLMVIFLPILITIYACKENQTEPVDKSAFYYEGKQYHTVVIGNQTWIKENLNVGTMIQGNVEQTNNGVIEKYCLNNDESNGDKYGAFYQWAEAVQYTNSASNTDVPNPAFTGKIQGICPSGFHIPTVDEINTLREAIGWDANSLKALGQGYSGGEGTNKTNFSALLTGFRNSSGFYDYVGDHAFYWSTGDEMIKSNSAFTMCLNSYDNKVELFDYYKVDGFNVRCIKD